VTCSVLPEENDDQLAWFSARRPDFTALAWRDVWSTGVGGEPPSSGGGGVLLLTPARHGTDGFFVAILVRAA
jgi:16S rRNA (cytosine967-C5)-methyltransferase